jgi:hypothetical protein
MAMFFTPTDKGSLFAGIGLWSLGWATVYKLETIPIINRFFKREKLFQWIGNNKGTTLLITEFVNAAVHGISNPTGVIFMLGGTFINIFMVMIGIPMSLRRNAAKRREDLLRGVA